MSKRNTAENSAVDKKAYSVDQFCKAYGLSRGTLYNLWSEQTSSGPKFFKVRNRTLISIAAAELITHFDELRSVKLRVGALPQHPNNVLKYSLTWSTEGLINEYGNPCQAIVDGKVTDVAPLEGLEEIEIDGTLYEAFNTSGGLGSLA